MRLTLGHSLRTNTPLAKIGWTNIRLLWRLPTPRGAKAQGGRAGASRGAERRPRMGMTVNRPDINCIRIGAVMIRRERAPGVGGYTMRFALSRGACSMRL